MIDFSKVGDVIDSYQNMMQIKATLIDSKNIIGKIARAGGKTRGLLVRRLINVGFAMPQELSFLIHKTYVAALTNMIPAILGAFKEPKPNGEPMFREEIDYVYGTSKLPNHFKKPRREIINPKHSLVLRSGHHYQIVSSDQPESMAGQDGVHAFVEEMKHNKGEKVKTRIFPGLRGAPSHIRNSHYYQGITGISDAARVDLGEDNWFEEYEKLMDNSVINEIANVSKHVNDAMFYKLQFEQELLKATDNKRIAWLKNEIFKKDKIIRNWSPRLNRMRKSATYYITASAFVNKDILGVNFFRTQFQSLTIDEFLTAICNIAPKQVTNMFFGNFKKSKHCYSDGYKYGLIMNLELSDSFKLTAHYIKHYNPHEPLILMYDPGNFSSVLAAQFDKKDNTLYILKEFYCWTPRDQAHLAREIFNYFGEEAKNKRIELYYDRAGNKRREIHRKITTDAKQLKFELDVLGFSTRLQNERQRTIFYSEHHKLALILFGGERRDTPRIRIDENECPNLVSAIHLSPLRKKDDGRIELDKTSEEKVAFPFQAGLTTQLPSALTYGLYGLFSNFLPENVRKTRSLPSGINQ